jgi:hypothetical protein
MIVKQSLHIYSFVTSNFESLLFNFPYLKSRIFRMCHVLCLKYFHSLSHIERMKIRSNDLILKLLSNNTDQFDKMISKYKW